MSSSPSLRCVAGALAVASAYAFGAAGCTGDRSGMAAPAEVLLEAPAPGEGFQIATDQFTVAPGSEQTNCYFHAVPFEAGKKVWATRFIIATAVGTHHAQVHVVSSLNDLSAGAQDGDVVRGGLCDSGALADWPLVANSQRSGETFEWTLPPDTGMELEGGALLVLQVHFANATDTEQVTPGPASVVTNIYTTTTPPGTVAGFHPGTQKDLRVCPGETISWTGRCRFPSDQDRTIIATNGHFHARGRRFTATVLDPAGFDLPPGTPAAAPYYESLDWAEPDMATDLDVVVPAGGGVEFTCEYVSQPTDCGDPDDSCCFKFGNQTQRAEHCVLFLYVSPREAAIYTDGRPSDPALAIDCALEDPERW